MSQKALDVPAPAIKALLSLQRLERVHFFVLKAAAAVGKVVRRRNT